MNGLSALVEKEMSLNLFSEGLFVFTNSRADILKMIYFDKTGYALWQKRLEKDHFFWPRHLENENIQLESWQLEWLLEGIDLSKVKPHSNLTYKNTV